MSCACDGRQELGHADCPSSTSQHQDSPCPAREQLRGWGSPAAMGALALKRTSPLCPPASAARDESSASQHRSALGLGTTGNVVTPAFLPCTFGRFSLKSGLACGFRGS